MLAGLLLSRESRSGDAGDSISIWLSGCWLWNAPRVEHPASGASVVSIVGDGSVREVELMPFAIEPSRSATVATQGERVEPVPS
jgi:hypothetical protein